MREEFYYESLSRSQMVSVNVINNISNELIAKVDNSAELKELLDNELKAEEARKNALLIAYKEFPIPSFFGSSEDRKEFFEKRNKRVEELFNQLMNKN